MSGIRDIKPIIISLSEAIIDAVAAVNEIDRDVIPAPMSTRPAPIPVHPSPSKNREPERDNIAGIRGVRKYL